MDFNAGEEGIIFNSSSMTCVVYHFIFDGICLSFLSLVASHDRSAQLEHRKEFY